MRNFRHTKLVSVLCLLTFVMQSVVGAHLIRCTDSSATSRLEWGACERDDAGRCVSAREDGAGQNEQSGDPLPCRDTPVQRESGRDVGAAAGRSVTQAEPLGAPEPMLPRELFATAWSEVGAPARPTETRFALPPPGMSAIRTVILLV